jgi:hypothetical protein
MFPFFCTVDLEEVASIHESLQKKYKIKHLGDANLMLGMHVTRDRKARTIKLDQELYTLRLLEDYDMKGCVPLSTPAQVRQPRPEEESTDVSETGEQNDFRALVGSLLYLALSTRPDIAHAVAAQARQVAKPTAEGWSELKKILRYLSGTASYGLVYGGSSELIAYSDSDWAGDRHGDGRSTTGWFMMVGTTPISWTSRKQTIVALSSTEAEYIANGEAVQEVLWVRQLLEDIHQLQNHPILLRCDNSSAIALASNDKHHQRTKHINVKHHFIRQYVENNTIQLQWVPSEQQLADILTKPLGPNIFIRLRDQLLKA